MSQLHSEDSSRRRQEPDIPKRGDGRADARLEKQGYPGTLLTSLEILEDYQTRTAQMARMAIMDALKAGKPEASKLQGNIDLIEALARQYEERLDTLAAFKIIPGANNPAVQGIDGRKYIAPTWLAIQSGLTPEVCSQIRTMENPVMLLVPMAVPMENLMKQTTRQLSNPISCVGMDLDQTGNLKPYRPKDQETARPKTERLARGDFNFGGWDVVIIEGGKDPSMLGQSAPECYKAAHADGFELPGPEAYLVFTLEGMKQRKLYDRHSRGVWLDGYLKELNESMVRGKDVVLAGGYNGNFRGMELTGYREGKSHPHIGLRRCLKLRPSPKNKTHYDQERTAPPQAVALPRVSPPPAPSVVPQAAVSFVPAAPATPKPVPATALPSDELHPRNPMEKFLVDQARRDGASPEALLERLRRVRDPENQGLGRDQDEESVPKVPPPAASPVPLPQASPKLAPTPVPGPAKASVTLTQPVTEAAPARPAEAPETPRSLNALVFALTRLYRHHEHEGRTVLPVELPSISARMMRTFFSGPGKALYKDEVAQRLGGQFTNVDSLARLAGTTFEEMRQQFIDMAPEKPGLLGRLFGKR